MFTGIASPSHPFLKHLWWCSVSRSQGQEKQGNLVKSVGRAQDASQIIRLGITKHLSGLRDRLALLVLFPVAPDELVSSEPKVCG